MGKKSRLKKERKERKQHQENKQQDMWVFRGEVKNWETTFTAPEYPPLPPVFMYQSPQEIQVDYPDLEARRAIKTLYALEIAAETGLMNADPVEKLRELGMDPDKAESARPAFMEFLASIGGLEGTRPERAAKEPVLDTKATMTAVMAVRDYIFEHPGCIDISGKRAYYSQGFKDFILAMLAPGGLAEGVVGSEAETIVGIPWTRISAWQRKAHVASEENSAEPTASS